MFSLLVVASSRRDFRVVSVTLKRSDMLEELLGRVSLFEINFLFYLSKRLPRERSNRIVNKILKETYLSLSLFLDFLIL